MPIYMKIDMNGDDEISYNEASVVTHIKCSGLEILSLSGIEHFTALIELYCSHSQLTTLDVSKNAALRYLYCNNNQLTTLDISKNTALTLLYCNNNQLTTLDVSKNTAFTNLYCYYNHITTLDVSKNTALTELYCNPMNDTNGNNSLISILKKRGQEIYFDKPAATVVKNI